MAGVIDSNGQQWEHCNVCGEFIRIQDLLYEYGLDICSACVELPEQDRVALAERVSARRARERVASYEAMGWDVTLNPDNSISIHSTGGH